MNKANSQGNPLDALPSFQVYNRNDVNLVIEAKKVTDLDNETRTWIVDLMERNMKEMYVKSEWGWNADNKAAELLEEAAWYLLARDAETNKPLAFSHFRFVQLLISLIGLYWSGSTWTTTMTCCTATRSSWRSQ